MFLRKGRKGGPRVVKYVLTAVALKCFSAGPPMRRLYRIMGNLAGNRRRGTTSIPSYYLERIKRLLRLQGQYGLVHDGDRILELGTGWLHWEALTTRLFFDIEAALFDVWDNRQLAGLKNYVAQLGAILRAGHLGVSALESARAESLIQTIMKVDSFEELYKLLNFEYVIESAGSLNQFPKESFQLIVSGGVLEHVDREAVPHLLRETFRVLKPGGWAMHSIDTQDHLSHYDGTVSKKKYLSFSEREWSYLFENKVQYINRLQRGEWVELFKAAGFELVDEDSWRVELGQLKLAKRYEHMARGDLECSVLRVLFRKPFQMAAS